MRETQDPGDIHVRVLSASDATPISKRCGPTLSNNGRHDVIEGSNHSTIIGQQETPPRSAQPSPTYSAVLPR
jgi:hypothetical protein